MQKFSQAVMEYDCYVFEYKSHLWDKCGVYKLMHKYKYKDGNGIPEDIESGIDAKWKTTQTP